jgi:hypothetical protein
MALVRQRTHGNFLWYVYSNSKESKQILLKEKIIERGGKSLWDNFWRRQTAEDKTDDFNSWIVGEMVKIFVDNKLILKFELSDIEKLEAYFEILIQQNETPKLPLFQ